MPDVEPQDQGGGGIRINRPRSEVNPPIRREDLDRQQEEAEQQVTKLAKPGKIPLNPVVIKPPLRFEGLVLAQVTGFEGFIYTEKDLEDIAELVVQTGLEATPALQLLIGLLGLHAAKLGGYVAWVRAGKPGRVDPAPAPDAQEEQVQ